METTLDIFTANDLRKRSANLFQDMENGQLALVTKKGRPSFLAIPFDGKLVQYGVHKIMAIQLFGKGLITLSQAAKIAELSLEDFIEFSGKLKIPVVDYDPAELADELRRAL